MLKKLSFIDFYKAIQEKIESKTGLRCYDDISQDAPSPFYYAEIVGLRPENTKTMYVDVFTVFVHAIAEPGGSSIGIYKLIQELEEAMTERIDIGEEYWILEQTSQGLQRIQTDETNEKHAILAYEFKICYGFKIK
ncbi:DUF5072 family protein [Anaerosalibacter massiliensis]|uniref:DUF5072 domain-containing protein n=1 Tax=Anaerosalibacter massiliensis TaxID=1347392 RepID=A0A9X2ML27_9FIRM|nr:DUF5072 family protein [Anaerosalibacter massiliensis]MCR2045488.1 DUF5072 domain-containing protein [Anaerosalibacter massiliensis]